MTPKRKESKPEPHKWEFKPRFRRNAFGWKSQPAVTRVKQAVAEIKKVAKQNPLLAAEGAVLFIERISPALEHVDSSSGAIGTAVNNAIGELAAIIKAAPADAKTREGWLERLFDAQENDESPYIESLGEHWGTLCASKEVASAWADRLIGIVECAWSPDPELRGHFNGTTNCLSALVAAERYTELLALLELARDKGWCYRQFGVQALAAQGMLAEAIQYAEESRGPGYFSSGIARACEQLLLSSGQSEEAYQRYGLEANQTSTYLGTFRAISKKYPHKPAIDILTDLVESTPGEEGKWFAAAKDAGLYDDALALAQHSPCDPKTLTRAARDFSEKEPTFALGAGLLALHWLVKGYGYDITGFDVMDAYRASLAAAERLGCVAEVTQQMRQLIATEPPGGFVTKLLRRDLGL
jgi:hypothetical protein